MECNFEKKRFACLAAPVREVQSSEQTQEIRLSDGMPDVGKVLAAWGQAIVRSKEWRADSVAFSGGMMVWVLYAPEDGTQAQCLESWIPFQMKWELPENTPQGQIRIRCLPRFVDARSVSARKVLVRAGMAVLAEAFVPVEAEVAVPGKIPEDVQLLKSLYPVRVPMEAGEKSFVLEENLILPEAAPQPEKVICYRLNPQVTDKKVLTDKLAFRGAGNLHVLYRSREGQLHSWDFELPFSQYAQLEQEHGADAQPEVHLMATSLELELDEEGHLTFRTGLAAGYLITDRQLVELVEDAYSTTRELTVQPGELALPALLESRRENLSPEQSLTAEATVVADVWCCPDFPRQRRDGEGVQLELPVGIQVLYYGDDGQLHSGTGRWEGQLHLAADPDSAVQACPVWSQEPQALLGAGTISLKAETQLELLVTSGRGIAMIAGLELGEPRAADPGRPCLILQRKGTARLWDIAKASHSTVEDIRRANRLQEEPPANQMLLIPVR